MIIVLLGGPASGKGTRAKIASDAFAIPHISTGDILRATKDSRIHQLISEGKLIDDDLVSDALYLRLLEPDCQKGFLLDGYPRTFEQAALLNGILRKLNTKIDMIVELQVPDHLVYERILDRRQCNDCGKIFGSHVVLKKEGKCNDCGGELSKRSDDTHETLTKRLEIHKANIEKIREYYLNTKLWHTLNSSSNPEKIIQLIDDSL